MTNQIAKLDTPFGHESLDWRKTEVMQYYLYTRDRDAFLISRVLKKNYGHRKATMSLEILDYVTVTKLLDYVSTIPRLVYTGSVRNFLENYLCREDITHAQDDSLIPYL